jgi:hypothetical protein
MEKNSVLKLEQGAPSSVSAPAGMVSCPLLRYFLHRDLSPLLIIMLFFFSPLTFSNENIPNFQPDCAANFSLSEKPRSTVVNARAVTSPVIAPPAAGVVPPQVHYLLTHNTPLHSVKTSRAPPHQDFFL